MSRILAWDKKLILVRINIGDDGCSFFLAHQGEHFADEDAYSRCNVRTAILNSKPNISFNFSKFTGQTRSETVGHSVSAKKDRTQVYSDQKLWAAKQSGLCLSITWIFSLQLVQKYLNVEQIFSTTSSCSLIWSYSYILCWASQQYNIGYLTYQGVLCTSYRSCLTTLKSELKLLISIRCHTVCQY